MPSILDPQLGPFPGSRWIVIETGLRLPSGEWQARHGKPGTRAVRVRCQCPAQVERVIALSSLLSGNSRSCGCLQREVAIENLMAAKAAMTTEEQAALAREAQRLRWPDAHGFSRHPLYGTWYNMVDRCTNPRSKDYPYYGGRQPSPIRVCDRWLPPLGPELFIRDIERYLGSRPEGMTLDRICGLHDYRLDNVRWADDFTQRANRAGRFVLWLWSTSRQGPPRRPASRWAR